jgi:ribosomal protein S18 acetylase RimI-like enzyme
VKPPTLLQQADEALADGIALMLSWQGGGETLRTDHALIARGERRFPTPYSNSVLPLGEPCDPDLLLRDAEAFFPDRRFILWTRGPVDAALSDAVTHRGYARLGQTPVMVATAPMALRSEPSGVRLCEVNDAPGLDALIDVCALAYEENGLPRALTPHLFSRVERVLGCGAVLALARTEQSALAAAIALVDPPTGRAGLYWVATRPESRRRGLGDAITRFTTNAAFARGASFVALQASAAGEPIYRRMGYRAVADYERYLSPAARKR